MKDVELCKICGKPLSLDGSRYPAITSWEDGLAHDHCVERLRCPQTVKTLEEVANGRPDAVLSVEVIVELVPVELAAQIVRTYNRRLLLQWEKRCEEPT